MLYIKKGKEPSSLTSYKKGKFAYFDGCNKEDIRKHLLDEQGKLCAYCMRRIDENHMKIEHWYPEDRLTESQKLDYKNMFRVCEGHIDGQKGNWNYKMLQTMKQKYSRRDTEGKKREYAGIVLWYLDKKINSIEGKRK